MPDSKSDDEIEAIRAAIFAGRKIEAIKLYRQCTGLGLTSAKNFVDTLEEELRRVAPERFAAPSARGCAGVFVLIFALLVALAKS